MDAAVWGFVGALAGAVIGATASIATTVISSRNEAKLQSQADSLDRSERSRAFQRENLLAVQDALQDLGRATGRAHHQDVMAHRAGAQWGRTPLDGELDEALGLANRRLSALVERVGDDTLRSELKAVHSQMNQATLAPSQDEADILFRESMDSYEQAMSHLGAVLRSHY